MVCAFKILLYAEVVVVQQDVKLSRLLKGFQLPQPVV